MARPPPGPPRDPALHAELETVLAAKGKNYAPRTHLRDAGQPRYVNRLVREASPYLLQHAHNPVDWWPWGDAALAEAARRDVPVFLSAGYATCHWCHVMEDESFDNEEVAELLNGNFLPVKLDREQRPDVDHIYITATSVQQGQAGWPNSVWALPDGSPFHTGTYFPRRQFMQVLSGVAGGWREKRKEIEAFARQFSARLREIAGRRAPAADLAELPDRAFTDLRRAYNPDHGGFSTGTQFPHEGYLLFLLDHWRREGGEEAREMARHSLDMMARGGLHDHVGGGFHRYSVDVGWCTPHFEKMLYNQALLMQCYTQLWQVTDDPSHARSVARCAEYVARDMTAEDGAFFAAEDADSLDAEGRREEGAFFVWSPRQAEDALGTDAAAAIRLLNLDAEPTVEAGPVAHLTPGATVDFGRLDPILERLRAARDARPRPLRDEKVIGGWNGLMIRALAEAGIALDRGEWVAMAERAAVAVFSRLETRGGLARLHAGGAALEAANLTDYAWLGLACVALADATGDGDWLRKAAALCDELTRRFANGDGRLKLVRDDTPIGPVLEMEDGAVPSGESSALELIALLQARMPDPARRAAADALAAALSGIAAGMPVSRLPALTAWRCLNEGESGYTRAGAAGALRSRLVRRDGGWRLDLEIRRGWHIAASAEQGLSGARITGAEVRWPEPKAIPSPLGGDLAAYTGTVSLDLADCEDEIQVHVQLCSESICLAPETIRYRLP